MKVSASGSMTSTLSSHLIAEFLASSASLPLVDAVRRNMAPVLIQGVEETNWGANFNKFEV